MPWRRLAEFTEEVLKKMKKLQRFSYWSLAAIGALFILAAVILSPISGWGNAFILPIGFLAGPGLAFCFRRLSFNRSVKKFLNNQNHCLALALGATLIMGGTWLLVSRVEPTVDFDRIYRTAAALAQGGDIPDGAYQAVFPHLLTTPFFLSLFFRLLGPSVALAQMINLALSLVSAALLFFIGKRLLGLSGGLCAGLLWAFMPSHWMLLSLVCTEPLHIALTLLSILLFQKALEGRLILWGATGSITGLASLVRPIGPIYLTAFILCYAVFFRRRGRRSAAVASLALMVAAYIAVTAAGSALYGAVLKQPVASGGFGWNLYVGMSDRGNWNAEDYTLMRERLDAEVYDAPEIQAMFRDDALERLQSRVRDGSIIRLAARKFTQLWCQDSFSVYWLSDGMREDSPVDIRAMAGKLSAAANLAYGMLLGLCALSLLAQIRIRNTAFILPVVLIIGVALAFILLEANPRYHYAGSAALCLLGAGFRLTPPQYKERTDCE